MTPAEQWLNHFAVRQHGMLQSWFRHAIVQGATTPGQVLHNVRILVAQKIAWSTTPASRNLCHATLEALQVHPEEALAYAAAVLAEAEGTP